MKREEWVDYIINNIDKDYIETEENSIFLDYVEGEEVYILYSGYVYYLGDDIALNYKGEFICV